MWWLLGLANSEEVPENQVNQTTMRARCQELVELLAAMRKLDVGSWVGKDRQGVGYLVVWQVQREKGRIYLSNP